MEFLDNGCINVKEIILSVINNSYSISLQHFSGSSFPTTNSIKSLQQTCLAVGLIFFLQQYAQNFPTAVLVKFLQSLQRLQHLLPAEPQQIRAQNKKNQISTEPPIRAEIRRIRCRVKLSTVRDVSSRCTVRHFSRVWAF